MSVLLYVVGALVVMAGAAAILFGIPVKEFSFGDTLIVAGTVSLVGGLIVIGLGAAVSQLQRMVEMLGARPLSRAGRPVDVLEAARGGRVPFPPKPRSELKPESRAQPAELPPFVPAPIEEPPVAEAPAGFAAEQAAPSIRNPDLPLPAEEPAEEPMKSEAPFVFPDLPPPPAAEPPPPPPRAAPLEPPPWRRSAPRSEPRPEPAQPSYFDAMWKNEPRTPPAPPVPEPIRSHPESIARAPLEEPEPLPLPDEEALAAEPPRAVAVLKSGVVDGMGYTLYVDGSIEAELPDGTLRFASINELRAHLEKTG